VVRTDDAAGQKKQDERSGDSGEGHQLFHAYNNGLFYCPDKLEPVPLRRIDCLIMLNYS
jgi:hypothetical protein